MKFFQKSTFLLFLIEEIDIYQILLVPWNYEKILFLAEVITGQRSAPVLKGELQNLSSTVFEQSPWNFQDMFYGPI